MKVDLDAYGRTVAIVRLGDRDVAAEMLRAGCGWAFRRYLGRLEGDDAYCALEYQARAAEVGLWALAPRQRIPPWVRRHPERGWRSVKAESSPEDCVAGFEEQ